MEELYVRGLLLNLVENMFIKNKNKTMMAIISSSVIFGLGHIFDVLGQPILIIITKVIMNQLTNINIPTVVLAGENDIVKFEHTKIIANNIKNSKMEIILGENHGSYIIHSEKIYNIIKKYL